MNRTHFFTSIRAAGSGLFGRVLNQSQVDGISAILDHWESAMPAGDLRWLGYMLATVFHETAHTMQPVRETLAESDGRAIAILDRAFAAKKLPWVKSPYWRPDASGKSWLGRGLVQLTHRDNYLRLGQAVGVDLVADPGLAMQMEIAVRILFEGMIGGLFTGRKLADYFTDAKADWVGARRIITGPESMQKVAVYARLFDAAISASRQTRSRSCA